ncbi:UNKNOWN [Stylonychia lemnae]|uniref:EamA domain-containing protein n=1 Tax=Stylonychia lemnae TaxID=5949 RepID=A0A078A209_STYLE|nr:UNKNOWN [Stylonychia lemnae]|eukprot:CDW75842.1 UNKNOWN [Stylonychia lemnae]
MSQQCNSSPEIELNIYSQKQDDNAEYSLKITPPFDTSQNDNKHEQQIYQHPSIQNSQNEKIKAEPRTNFWFWFFSLSACLSFTGSNILRNHQSQNVMFSLKILLLLILGGSFEYLGSQMIVLSFKYASLANVNQGICSALVSTNTIYILIASYFIFKERIQTVQLVGVILMVIAVLMVSIFRVDKQIQSQDIEDENSSKDIFLMIIGGLIASIMFGSQLLMFKKITQYNNDLFGVAFSLLFFSSIWAIISFIYMFLTDVDYGLIGISNAIVHNQVILLSLFNYVVYDQDLSFGQAIGIGICVIGAILITNGDRMTCFNKKK